MERDNFWMGFHFTWPCRNAITISIDINEETNMAISFCSSSVLCSYSFSLPVWPTFVPRIKLLVLYFLHFFFSQFSTLKTIWTNSKLGQVCSLTTKLCTFFNARKQGIILVPVEALPYQHTVREKSTGMSDWSAHCLH